MQKIFSLFLIILILSSCNSGIYKGEIIDIPDGDTIKVQTKKLGLVRVRLLGIDCPEINQEPWGRAAKAFLIEEIGENQEVKLETDLVVRDKYGRLLAYVYEKDAEVKKFEKISLNEKLLANGFAELFMIGENDRYASKFKIAEAKAKQAKINIWDSKEGLKLSPYEFRRKHRKK